MKRYIAILLVIGCALSLNAGDLTTVVDPFIGTGGHGHTYPGAALPFGMVQLSPDTRLTGWDGCSGYHYSDSVVYGFSHTHLSGTGVSDYGDILLMPTTGKIQLERGSAKDTGSGYCSSFSHGNETASPGYYSVLLEDYDIHAELTVTARTGIHRYRFPAGKKANIIIDLSHRDTVLASGIEVINNREIAGFRRSSAWAKDQHVYFVARFSQPFTSQGSTPKDKDTKLYVSFGSDLGLGKKGEKKGDRPGNRQRNTVTVKVGISAVSIEGARKNLEAEAEHLNFDQIKAAATKSWETALNKIRVDGGSDSQKRIFYTSLYHALLNPNLYMDSDGHYRGRDLKVHQAHDFTNYTVFSLWDTYRALHPLFTIIEPDRTNDFIRTFITQYEQGGLLPVWELSANETFCMIGYHSVPVMVDAYIKGIKDYDIEKAYEAMKHSAMQDHLGLKHYRQTGYIPAGEESESVSKTLEYAYDDWCIAQMAKALGKETDYAYFIQRAQFYKNLYDPGTGFMRAKMKGSWFSPFDPSEVNFNYTEANSWQYSFYVPQDIAGLMSLMGGKKKFLNQLDALFNADSRTTGREQADITGLIGQYAHGNEPSHHMAYLYTYANKAWKTQQKVRQIMDTLYTDKPDGLCGNEDCGQMSAWYVMSALGFYPVTPGSEDYVIGTPLFKKASIDVGGGKRFTVTATNVSEKKFYIQNASLNGNAWTQSRLKHSSVMKGGELVFEMGATPNKKWGSGDGDIPVSIIEDHRIQPLPFVASGSPTFETETAVTLGSVTPGAQIYYTLDNSSPSPKGKSFRYKKPILLKASTTVKAIAISPDVPVSSRHVTGVSPKPWKSGVMTARFNRIPADLDIRLHSSYASQYSAGGDKALIDGIRGSGDFRTGTWQGYQGTDLEAVIDLGKEKNIQHLSTGFLQDHNAWIFMPLKVDYFVSLDGKSFTHAGTAQNTIPHRREGSIIQQFTVKFKKQAVRFIKVKATALINCPDWHKGSGNKSWIFADEVVVN